MHHLQDFKLEKSLYFPRGINETDLLKILLIFLSHVGNGPKVLLIYISLKKE